MEILYPERAHAQGQYNLIKLSAYVGQSDAVQGHRDHAIYKAVINHVSIHCIYIERQESPSLLTKARLSHPALY